LFFKRPSSPVVTSDQKMNNKVERNQRITRGTNSSSTSIHVASSEEEISAAHREDLKNRMLQRKKIINSSEHT
jgi:hypothetical protein